MTISNTDRSATATGDGLNKTWPYTFRIPNAASVNVVTTVLATGVQTVIDAADYTITGLNADAGGEVTYPTVASGDPALAAGVELTIYRSVPQTQESAVSNQTRYDAGVVETVWDRLTMMIQDITGDASLALAYPKGDAENNLLPVATLRANKVVAFDAGGGATVSTSTISELESGATSASASAAAALASELAAAASETAAGLSAASAATSAASLPNAVTAGADAFLQVNAAGDGWDYHTAAQFRTAAGLEIGTNVQAYQAAQATATWEAGVGTTESVVSPAKVAAAIAALETGGAVAASQAEMETATSTAVYSSPGQQHSHPGHPKAVIAFNGTGTISIEWDFGVASITDNGPGDYTITFDTAFSAATYAYIANCDRTVGTTNATEGIQVVSRTTTAFRFICATALPAATDQELVTASFFGDQ